MIVAIDKIRVLIQKDPNIPNHLFSFAFNMQIQVSVEPMKENVIITNNTIFNNQHSPTNIPTTRSNNTIVISKLFLIPFNKNHYMNL